MNRLKEVANQNRNIWISLKKEIIDQVNHGMPKVMGERLLDVCDKKFIEYSKRIEHISHHG